MLTSILILALLTPLPVGVQTVTSEPAYHTQTMEVTAYTAGYESTGKRPDHPLYGITASGRRVKPNHTIAAPRSIPFGTRIYIPALDETYVVEDRGGAITDGHLDVYMTELDDALQFGRQELTVRIYKNEEDTNE